MSEHKQRKMIDSKRNKIKAKNEKNNKTEMTTTYNYNTLWYKKKKKKKYDFGVWTNTQFNNVGFDQINKKSESFSTFSNSSEEHQNLLSKNSHGPQSLSPITTFNQLFNNAIGINSKQGTIISKEKK